MARETPVEPTVPSVMSPPVRNAPDSRESSIIWSATRSLMDPPGLRNSALASTVHPVRADRALRWTSGVFPIRLAMVGDAIDIDRAFDCSVDAMAVG
jgi:hypothetical protein